MGFLRRRSQDTLPPGTGVGATTDSRQLLDSIESMATAVTTYSRIR